MRDVCTGLKRIASDSPPAKEMASERPCLSLILDLGFVFVVSREKRIREMGLSYDVPLFSLLF